MRKETAADSSPRSFALGFYGYRRGSHAQSIKGRTAAPLALAAMALLLTTALAACGAATAPRSAAPSASVGAARQGAAAGSGSSSALSGAAAGPVSHADVLAAARRVKCPASIGGISSPGRWLRAKPVPAGFKPLAVIECIEVPGIVPVGGPLRVEVRRMAVSGLGRLVAALRLPSTPRVRGLFPACLPPVAALPWIVLIGPGDHLLYPRIPTGACGLPIVPVQVSLRSLHWRTLSITERISVDPPPVNGTPVPNIHPAVKAPNSGVLS